MHSIICEKNTNLINLTFSWRPVAEERQTEVFDLSCPPFYYFIYCGPHDINPLMNYACVSERTCLVCDLIIITGK